MDFSTYFLMQDQDAAAYVLEKTDFFPHDASLRVTEIGDGNLNYVFRVEDTESGRSLIVKQAGEELRITKDMRITTDRNRIESEILTLYMKTVPGLTPRVYGYDTVMCACVMEDLRTYRLMRTALIAFDTFPRFAEDISRFLARTLFYTSDVVMEHKQKKEMLKHFCNPELCEITEDLVFTEPYNDQKGRNLVLPENHAFVERELYCDQALHLAAAELKFAFMTHAQALLHGDLHTGSVFVTRERTMVFDPEFAFFGPMGYDIGNVLANLLFAWARGEAMGQSGFCGWVLDTVRDVPALFSEEFLDRFAACAADAMAKTPGFARRYLDGVLADTAGYTGTELIRRMVGMAQVKDITTIPDPKKRARAERILILLGKKLILSRKEMLAGEDYLRLLDEALHAPEING